MTALASSIAQERSTPASSSMRQDLKMLYGMTTLMQRADRHFLPLSSMMPLFLSSAPIKQRQLQAPELPKAHVFSPFDTPFSQSGMG